MTPPHFFNGVRSFIACPVCGDDIEGRCRPWNDDSPWLDMKCSSIPDALFVDAVREACARRGGGWAAAARWDVACVLAGRPEVSGSVRSCQDWPAIPEKLVLAKAGKLIKRGLIDGCACGCRGDFMIAGHFERLRQKALAAIGQGSVTKASAPAG